MRVKKGRIIFSILIIVTAILIGLLHADAANEKTIAFEDENLYYQVKKSLGEKVIAFDNDKKTITVDIDEVTSLVLYKVKNLDGIEQFTNLEWLEISNVEGAEGENGDVVVKSAYKLEGLEKLKELSKLKDLSLRYCQLDDSNMDVIGSLNNLKKLGLSNNEITDVSKISKMFDLENLNISGNKIQDINPLNNLKNLKYLYASDNNISDISAVSGMRELMILDFSKNKVSDISVISKLTKLKEIVCSNNEINDISSLSSLRKLNSVELSGNHIKDFEALMALPDLKIDDTYLNRIGKQVITINIKDGDTIKLPPIVKQAFEIFDAAEGVDCINCSVTDTYDACIVDPNVEGARIRISKGSLSDSIIDIKPTGETEAEYKVSETEKKQIKEGKKAEKAIISLPKNLVIVLAILIVGTWIGSIIIVCKKKKVENSQDDKSTKE